MGVSENRGPQYSTLNSRILIIRSQNKVPLFSETPICSLYSRIEEPPGMIVPVPHCEVLQLLYFEVQAAIGLPYTHYCSSMGPL